MPDANRNALISIGVVEIYPHAPAAAYPAERHIVGGPGGRYRVIEGRFLHEGTLSREEAEELARPN